METPLIAAFAFGVPEGLEANRLIGKIASDRARELRTPVYAQEDVPIDAGIEVQRISDVDGNPPPTLRIARGAVQFAVDRGIRNVRVACARPHAPRVVRDLRRAAEEARVRISISACEEIFLYPRGVWYSRSSDQLRTRSPLVFWMREAVLRALPFWVYRRIAA